MFHHSGVLNTEPLGKFVDDVMDEFHQDFKRKVVVSAVDVNSGAYLLYNETTPEPTKAILSSAAIPFVFPAQKWDTSFDMDGGSVWNTNLVSAIDRCKEIVEDDSQIYIDIIECSAMSQIEGWEDTGSTVNNYLRFREVKDYYSNVGDIVEFMEAHKNVNYRYYVEPTAKIPGGLKLIDATNKTVTWPMQLQGRKDGAASVN